MNHLDAKAIRERLNAVMLAITTLEDSTQHLHHKSIAVAARTALREIALLVTDDEIEEHGAIPVTDLRQQRSEIRAETLRQH